MDFNNKRFITIGVSEKVNLFLQCFMWQCIDGLEVVKDYLQVFDFKEEDNKRIIVHSQEEPEYKKEYLFRADIPFFVGKIFVIDDETHSTMFLAEEY